MIRINLLPFRAARKKENVRRQVSYFLLSVILVVLVFAYGDFYLRRTINALEDKKAEMTAELKKFNEINREITEIKKKLEILKQKNEIVERISLDREKAVRLLDDLTRVIIKKQMMFTGLTESNDVIQVTGTALDNQIIASFMRQLEAHPRFGDVVLVSSRQKRISDSEILKDFRVNFKLIDEKTQAETKKAETK